MRYRIAAIPGDGVGMEVIPHAIEALRAAGEVTDRFSIEITDLPWSCAYYLRHGRMMPSDGLEQLRDHDAILLGAIGYPGVDDSISLWGLLLPIRQAFDQYVNLRPIRSYAGIPSPLRAIDGTELDILCVRENTEGEYVGAGGRHGKTPGAVALQTSIFTWRGTERVSRYAFDRARERGRRLASATKSNALQYSAVLWDEVVAAVSADYPDVAVTSYHVDALAARFVLDPLSLDVVVASNLFGDILTDLGAALQGSLGLAASGNLNPERLYPSMFEPVHGSAPRRAGQGTANPMAAVSAAAMMLRHLGESDAAALVDDAIAAIARSGPRTRDIGGKDGTAEVGVAIASHVRSKTPAGG